MANVGCQKACRRQNRSSSGSPSWLRTSEAKAAFEKRNAEFDEDDAQAAADPYGAILGYHDPNLDAEIIFTKVCSFSEDENKRYLDAYDRLRRMLDSELLRHISDESDVLCDVLIGILQDLQTTASH